MPLGPIIVLLALISLVFVVLVFRKASRSGRGVEPISSSIVVAAGAALMIGGAYHNFSGPRVYLMTVGSIIGAIGVILWLASWYHDSDPSAVRK